MSSSYSSLDWVLSHWAHFTVPICLCLFVFFMLHIYYITVTRWGGPGWIEILSINHFQVSPREYAYDHEHGPDT